MVKVERDLRKRIESAGLEILSIHKVKGHYHAELRNPTGMVRKLSFAGSPSDHRAILNEVSQLRRFAKEGEAPTPQVPLFQPREEPIPVPAEEALPTTPQPEKEIPVSQENNPSHEKGKGKVVRNQLPQKEVYRLCQLLDSMDLKGYSYATQLVSVCQERLQVPVTEINIRTALKTIGKELKPPRAAGKKSDRDRVLASALLGLYTHLRLVAPQELVDMAKE